MHFGPLPGVHAGKDDDLGRGIDGVPVRATAEGQPKPPPPADQVGEGVVFAVVEHAADICHVDARPFVGMRQIWPSAVKMPQTSAAVRIQWPVVKVVLFIVSPQITDDLFYHGQKYSWL